ncbi:MAG: hypothetical protein ACI85I_001569 [Arenicella sp.]|jgi:hypothetical protein
MKKEEIVETAMIRNEKGLFFVHLCEHSELGKYVRVSQKVSPFSNEFQSITINPSFLDNMIEVLQKYKSQINPTIIRDKTKKNVDTKPELHHGKYEEMVLRYLKGISPKELCLQFGITIKDFEQILQNKNIVFLENNTKPPFKRRYWKRTR